MSNICTLFLENSNNCNPDGTFIMEPLIHHLYENIITLFKQYINNEIQFECIKDYIKENHEIPQEVYAFFLRLSLETNEPKELINLLCENGALLHYPDNNYFNLLHYSTGLSFDMFKQIFGDKDLTLFYQTNIPYHKPILFGCLYQHICRKMVNQDEFIKILRFLIEKNPEICKQELYGYTPLKYIENMLIIFQRSTEFFELHNENSKEYCDKTLQLYKFLNEFEIV